jgi:hypothetical protein
LSLLREDGSGGGWFHRGRMLRSLGVFVLLPTRFVRLLSIGRGAKAIFTVIR